MNTILEQINLMGKAFVEFALPMLAQSSALIIILLLLDFVLSKKVRAVFRYWMWMLVLVKVILPASLSSPVSVGYWFGNELRYAKISDMSTVVNPANTPHATELISIEVSSEAPAVTPTTPGVEPAIAKPVSPPAVSETPVAWQGVVFLAWAAVVIAMALLLLQRAIFVSGLVAQAKEANNLMTDALDFCRTKMGIKGKVGLKVSANATSPAVCGLFRPVILVPQDLGPSLGAGHLRAVLMHELAHIKRADCWVNLAQTILQIVYFYNPLLWLANSIIRRVREQAVDETVQVAMGEKAESYPETLLNVARLAFKQPALSLRLIGVVESKSLLKGRIKRMLDRPIPKSAKLGVFGLIAVLIIGAVLLPMAKAEDRSQRTDDRRKTKYAATLANGVTVELVGVCEYDGESKGWLKPDGTVFDPDLYVQRREEYKGQNRLAFVVKLNTEDFNLEFNIKDVESYSGMDLYDRSDNVLHNYKAAVALIKNDNDITDLRIGVATEPWQTIAQYRAAKRDISGPKGIIFSTPIESKNGTAISVRGDWDRNLGERRVVAIDKQGQTHIGSWYGRSSWDKTISMSEFKKILPEQIEQYELQFRPYKWVTFKNVSLRPGTKTDVQVEVERASKADKFRASLKKKVMANITQSPDGDRLTVQYAVIAVCKAAGVPYQWEKSSKLAGAKCRRYIKPVHINNVVAEKAIRDVISAVGLTFEVDDNGLYLTPNSNTSNLQSLIDSARPGGTVIVPKGVYTEPIEITKPLTLKGQSRTDCVFEVTADRPAIFVDTKGKGRVTIENVTIKWQLATSDKNIEYPFAVAVKDTKAKVTNCSFLPLGNFKRSPVAIRAIGFSKLTIDTCRFEGFEYVVCYGEGTKGTIQNSLVMDSGHQGISLYSDATVKVVGNVVTGSKYHAVRSTGGTLHMKDNLIIENANRGVYLGNKSASGTITNNIIMGNATGIGGFANSKVKIHNNVIADSSYAGIGFRQSCRLHIANNIFYGNERGWIMFKGEGRNSNGCRRNTFWQNKVDAENFRKTANSILADPLFVNSANGDFSLRPGPAQEHKQGLTNPDVFKTLWKRWQRRADKNEPFVENLVPKEAKSEKTDVQIEIEQDQNIIPSSENKVEKSPQIIGDKKLNLSISIPADWQCYKSPNPGRYKFSWQLIPSESKAWAVFVGTGLTSEIKGPVNQIAVGDVAILKSYFDKYRVREDTWSDTTVAKLPATKFVADYISEGKQMVEYRTYLLNESMVYWFVFRIEKELFEVNRRIFDSIVNSFQLRP